METLIKYDKEIIVNFPTAGEGKVIINLTVVPNRMLFNMVVNGVKYQYVIRYEDGTKIFMDNKERIIRGYFTNTSIDWKTNPPNSLFPIISFTGTINDVKDTMELQLFAPQIKGQIKN